MAETKMCPKCGAELPANAPAGICPKCLMAAGLESDTKLPPDQPEGEPTTPRPTSSGFVPPEPQELAAKFPQLEILELLGKGGMGAVYKARQRELDRLVAVKILPPEVGADPAFAERFTREARALAKLNHQNIVQVYDFGRNDEFFYFIMEFVDGVNLRHTIQTGSLEPETALAIVPQICEALQFAHDEGIVHRDIKPENILIDKRGRVKIADFGLAKLLGQASDEFALTGTNQVMGTRHYMAPEQMQGSRAVDHRADIYSLGVLFYEMLTGELPIGRFEPPSKKVRLDVRLDEVVLRALESEPEKRYQHASDVKDDVETIATCADANGPATASDISADETAATESSSALSTICQTAGILVCLLGIGTMFLSWIQTRAVYFQTAIDWEHVFNDGTFEYPSGIHAQQIAYGYDLWQGIVVCASFCVLVAVLLLMFRWKQLVGWRYVSLLLGGVLIAIVAGQTVLQPPRVMNLPIQFSKSEPPGLRAEYKEEQGTRSDIEFLQEQVNTNYLELQNLYQPGPYYALALAGFLIVLGCVDLWQLLRSARDRRPEVRDAFIQRAVELERAHKPRQPRGLLARILIGLIAFSLFGICGGALVSLLIWSEARTGDGRPAASAPIPTNPVAPQMEAESTDYGSRVWVLGPEGPKLRDSVARSWVRPSQIEAVNKALQESFREYLAFEAQYVQQSTNEEGHVITVFRPLSKVLETLEDHLWSRLDPILNAEEQNRFRLNLELYPRQQGAGLSLRELVRPGFFGWDRRGARIEIWHEGTWFRWKVSSRGHEDSSTAPELPVELRRFWKEPGQKKTAAPSGS